MTKIEAVEHHNSIVDPKFRILCEEMIIAGHEITACTRIMEYITGDSLSTWVAMAKPVDPSSSYHARVVWYVIANEAGFTAEGGSYHVDVDEAFERYESRGGR
jgi:hypothetical protein